MAEVANAYDVVDLGEPDTSVEHLAEDLPVDGSDGRNAIALIGDGGSLAAFGLLEPMPEDLIEVFGRVHPASAGRGLGAYVVAWSEASARESARERGAPVRLHNGVTGTDRAAGALLRERGYEVVRFAWHMERSLTDLGEGPPDGPAGFVLRPAGTQDLAAVWRTMAESFAGHWEWRPLPFDEFRDHAEASRLQAVLALEGDELAGAVTFHPASRSGWIEELGVRPTWRRRGLGELLLHRAFAGLRDLGMEVARLNVDAGNETGAVRLYERVGMRIRREWLIYEKAVAAD
jgi:ribosomal protein S18 acetylase RimI-like enzyme